MWKAYNVGCMFFAIDILGIQFCPSSPLGILKKGYGVFVADEFLSRSPFAEIAAQRL